MLLGFLYSRLESSLLRNRWQTFKKRSKNDNYIKCTQAAFRITLVISFRTNIKMFPGKTHKINMHAYPRFIPRCGLELSTKQQIICTRCCKTNVEVREVIAVNSFCKTLITKLVTPLSSFHFKKRLTNIIQTI